MLTLNMKRSFFNKAIKTVVLFIFAIVSVSSAYAQNGKLGDFVTAIKSKSYNPIDYVFTLFEHSDIVVIGERDHRDTTQYELILDILRDPRFAKEIGYVYTEVGCVNRTSDVNKLLQKKYKSDTSFNDALYAYMQRGEVFYACWEKYNRMQFLKGLHEINRNNKHKITLGLTDCAFSWEDIHSPKEYKDFYYSPACEYRDSTMCANFSKMYAMQKPKKGKRKALIITNQPHAINATIVKKEYHRQGKWLKELYGNNNVSIVMLNWAEYTLIDRKKTPLVANGLWDAAFEVMDCQPFGMDIKGTPFGNTPYFNSSYGDLKWEDVADGIIFYKPYYETVLAIGIPDIVDKDFEKEFMRRTKIYFEAMNLPVPKFEDVKSAYDEFISVPGTYPQTPDSVKSVIRSLITE